MKYEELLKKREELQKQSNELEERAEASAKESQKILRDMDATLKCADVIFKDAARDTEMVTGQIQKIANETARVAEVAANAEQILNEIDEKFEKCTGLDATDIKFLFFATALQVTRWIIIAKLSQVVDAEIKNNRVKHDDAGIKEMERQKRESYKQKHDVDHNGKWEHNKSEVHRPWMEIVFDGVPYDVTDGSKNFGVNMGGGNYHRMHTLGHDPILGWVFGTINILSDTITLEDFRTYKIAYHPKPKHWTEQTNIGFAVLNAIDSIKEDIHRLPAAIFAQGLHLASDVTTKKGLPVPVLEAFSPELAGELYKSGYDTLCLMKDIAVVGSQAVVAILINMMITLIHGLYYDPSKHNSRDVYEVKTRKIIMYSNMMSSTSNLLYVGGSMALGNEAAIKSLDIGGLIVTIHRLMTDTKFIRQIKREFIEREFFALIRGNEGDFDIWQP